MTDNHNELREAVNIGKRARFRKVANDAKAQIWPEARRGHLVNAAALAVAWVFVHRAADSFRDIEKILKRDEGVS